MSPKDKEKSISEEEIAAFRSAVQDVKPLKSSQHKETIQPKTQYQTKKIYRAPEPNDDYLIDEDFEMPNDDWLTGEDCIHFARSGIQHRILKKLKKGDIPIEANLDLHNMTTHEAIKQVNQFIHYCRNHHFRWACVIHGKGYSSPNQKPILKNLLNQWLKKQPQVLAFHSAKPQHGGTGALYLLLKTKRGNNHS